MAGQRADPDLAALLADVRELREVVDVDQVLGIREPQLHHRQQAVPAGDDRAPRSRASAATRSRPRRWSRARTRMARGSAQSSSRLSAERPGSRLRGAPMSSRCSYCTGASVPMTGDLGSDSGLVWRISGYSSRAARLPRSTSLQRGAGRVPDGDRRLAAEPRQRERALRVDLADARRLDRRALREAPEPGGGRAGVQAFDEADGVRQAGLLHEQALEQVDAGVELLVDRRDDAVDRRALLHDLADVGDDLVQAGW